MGNTRLPALQWHVILAVSRPCIWPYCCTSPKVVNSIFIDGYDASVPEKWEGSEGWLDIRSGPSDGTVIKNNVFYSRGGNSLGFLGAQFKMQERFKHPIELNKVEQSGNVGYVENLPAAASQRRLAKARQTGFTGFEYRRITALSVQDGRVVIDPADRLFTEGYEYIEMSKIGLPASYPGEWRRYVSSLAMEKYFRRE